MRINGQTGTINTTPDSSTDVLSKLKPGDVVRVQIVDNSGSELRLRLSDGSLVVADSLVQVDAQEGEFVSFVFKGMNDGKLLLERMAPNVQQTQADPLLENIRNLLASIKLPVTDQNIKLAFALKNQGVEITSETMTKMVGILNKNPELKPDSAAFLTASKMPDNTYNIEKLQNLLAGRLKISNDIEELVKLFQGTSSSAKNSEFLSTQTYSKFIQSAIPEKAANVTNTANMSPTIISESRQTETTVSSTVPVNLAKAAASLLEEVTAQAEIPTNENKSKNITTISSNTNELENKLVENTANKSVQADTTRLAVQISNLIKGGVPLEKADLPILNSMNAEFEALMVKGRLTQEQMAGVKLITGEIADITAHIRQDGVPLDKGSNADSLKTFEAAVDSLKNLYIKIDQKADEINPQKLYKDLDDAISSLKEAVQQLPAGIREAAGSIVSNLENNVNFVNQLNNYSSYIQLPLSMFSKNSTGELYMLKRGSKAKKLDSSNLTVLISLDGYNIGRIDTLLSIDKRNVSTNFRIENSDVFSVLKDSHKMLYNSLLEKGFRLVDYTYRLIDEPINIVNFEAEAKKQFIKSPNTIDLTI